MNFCPQCGAQRAGQARFCGQCGAAFPEASDASEPPVKPRRKSRRRKKSAPATPPALPQTHAGSDGWQVAVGDDLPDARRLFDIPAPAPKRRSKRHDPEPPPLPQTKGKSLWGSTLWMAMTQGADLVTREMESGAPNDPSLSLRLTIASAVAVFGITLSSMPRLRSLLVRLGTAAIAVIQGQSVWPVVKQALMDPNLLSSFAPNLTAQAFGLLALLKLFKSASSKRI
ncbi:MAG: zinc ribbon domain-containing protein [Verrucomicrobiales bacterium]|nr:zinc ribbon domain-containing protein [Verrucomicrobiales bacterium]